eukprot:217733-Hanusia_phi.AAC.1
MLGRQGHWDEEPRYFWNDARIFQGRSDSHYYELLDSCVMARRIQEDINSFYFLPPTGSAKIEREDCFVEDVDGLPGHPSVHDPAHNPYLVAVEELLPLVAAPDRPVGLDERDAVLPVVRLAPAAVHALLVPALLAGDREEGVVPVRRDCGRDTEAVFVVLVPLEVEVPLDQLPGVAWEVAIEHGDHAADHHGAHVVAGEVAGIGRPHGDAHEAEAVGEHLLLGALHVGDGKVLVHHAELAVVLPDPRHDLLAHGVAQRGDDRGVGVLHLGVVEEAGVLVAGHPPDVEDQLVLHHGVAVLAVGQLLLLNAEELAEDVMVHLALHDVLGGGVYPRAGVVRDAV